MDHPELVEGAARGERPAADELLERHLPGLYAFVRLRMGERLRDMQSSLDFVQSTCRQVLQDLPRFEVHRDEGDFKRWLYRTAERKIIDQARRGQIRERALGRAGLEASDAEVTVLSRAWGNVVTPSQEAIARDALERIERAFEKLPENYREVIIEVRLLGRTPAQLAGKLAPTAGAVRVLLHRALARLAVDAGLEA